MTKSGRELSGSARRIPANQMDLQRGPPLGPAEHMTAKVRNAAPSLDPLVFTLPGKPVAWSRPRFNRASGNVFNSNQLRSFEALVRFTAGQELMGRPPFDGPVELTIRVQVAPARSWSKVRQAAALTGVLRPTGKPDASNIAKSIEDALNTIAYRDDSQVVRLLVEKRYGAEDLTVIDVRPA